MRLYFLYSLLLTGTLQGCTHFSGREAENGKLLLYDWDFSRQGTVRLDGKWKFTWIDTSTASTHATSVLIPVPGNWNGTRVGSQTISGQGTGIYELEIHAPQLQGKMVGFRLPVISTAAVMSVNDTEIFRAGSPHRPEYRPTVVPFVATDSVLHLKIRVYNYAHDKGGLRYPIWFGLAKDAHYMRYRAIAIEFWLIGCILMMGCYHLGIFFFRPANHAALYFGMFCILIAVRILFTGEYTIRHFVHISWFSIKCIEHLVFYLPFIAFIFFLQSLFPEVVSRRVVWGVTACVGVGVGMVLLTPSVIYTAFIDYFYPVGALFCLYGVYVAIRAVQQQLPGSIVFLIGYLALCLAYLNDILYSSDLLYTSDLIALGLFVLIICQSFVLLHRYSRALGLVEQTNAELSAKNEVIGRQNEELQRLNAEMDNVVYRISHDLRAPIASVLGLIDITRTEEDISQIRNYLDMKNKTLTRLDQTIYDIIEYSKNKLLEIDPQPIDFEAMIHDIVDTHQFMENADHVDMQVDCQVVAPFYSDRRRLEMILNNLVSNAIKYQDFQKTYSFVKITVRTTATEAMLSIEDNGQGIADEHHNRIFEMFYRTGTHTKSSGLGLYVVHDAIKKLGGTITLESKLKMGTTFHIKIPNLPQK